MRILQTGILLPLLAISGWASEARIAEAAQKGEAALV
jgi:hypothetical protein